MTTETSLDGAVLNERYRLAQRIGAGGMAEVYRAEDLMLERQVAVKLLHPALAADGAARERLRSEVRVLARMAHPGLVAVHDTGDQAGRAYLVMQLVDGGTLTDRLGTQALTLDETVRIGAELADVLAYLHDQRLVHRDLKPSNVLFDGRGRVLLADFGLVRVLDAAQQLTATNQTIGTAAYMAPEQVQGHAVGPATDIYALGLILVECLSGKPAYEGGSSFEVAVARLNRPPDIPPVDLPSPLIRLLTAMTRREPDARPTAGQVASRLRAVVGPPPSAGPDETAVLTLPPLDAPGAAPAHHTAAIPVYAQAPELTPRTPPARPRAQRLADQVGHQARKLWLRRDTPMPWGLRLDVTVLAVAAAVLFFAAAMSALSTAETSPDAPASTAPSPAAPTPSSQTPGVDRLPDDLDRLDRVVTP